MRSSIVLFGAIAAGAAAAALSACSGASNNALGLPVTRDARQFVRLAESDQLATHRARPDGVSRVLYVTASSYPGFTEEVLVLKYRRWTYLTSITNGINYPVGDWVDRNGNLYVANLGGGSGNAVLEYNFEGNLIFSYTAGQTQPQNVATDKYGNVYVADYAGAVYEYQQQSNNYISCTPASGYTEGVAVDKRGNVFVSTGGPPGQIVEYKGGLWNSKCTGTVLPIAFGDLPAIAIDRQSDLVVADYSAPAVDIVAPPYTSITGTVGSGWVHPYFVSIDRAGTQAYVGDIGSPQHIQIVTYPGGSPVATLSTIDGENQLRSAVDSENYVP